MRNDSRRRQSGLRWRLRLVYGASQASPLTLLPVGIRFMRLSILIPAMAVLGLAGCQVPAPTTAGAPVQAAATQASPAATPAPVLTPATPTDLPVAETEVDAIPAEEVEPAEAVPMPDQTNTSTQQAETAATEQADELATADEPADNQIADTTTESAETPTIGASREASEAPEGEDVAVSGVADTSVPGTEDVTQDEAPLAEENDGEVEIALAAPPPPPPPPPPPELDPATLIGLDDAALSRRLGAADFQRREGGMETRQYRLAECVVDYFLFPQDGDPQIVAWAWRAPVIGTALDAVACRRALAARDLAS